MSIPADPANSYQMFNMVMFHGGHGGWYETPDGMFCVADDTMVIPSGDYLIAHDGAWP